MLLQSGFEILGPVAYIAWRIDVLVQKHMIQRDADFHAGDLRQPEEIPVFFDLEIFIPTNRLKDIAIADEAIADENTLGNVTDVSIRSRERTATTRFRAESSQNDTTLEGVSSYNVDFTASTDSDTRKPMKKYAPDRG